MCRVPVNERRCRSNESCDDLDKKFIKYIRISAEPFLRGVGGGGGGGGRLKKFQHSKTAENNCARGAMG